MTSFRVSPRRAALRRAGRAATAPPRCASTARCPPPRASCVTSNGRTPKRDVAEIAREIARGVAEIAREIARDHARGKAYLRAYVPTTSLLPYDVITY